MREMQGKKLIAVGIGAIAFTVSGSAVLTATSGASSKKANKNLALIQGTKADDFYITMGCGAVAEAKKLGYKMNVQGPTDFSAPEQIPILNSVIASKPAALAIAATDVQALVAPEKAAVKKGIKLVQVDTAVNGGAGFAVSSITSNNFLGGEKAADALAAQVGDKGTVVVMNEQPGVSTTDARIAGFDAEMAEKYDTIHVLPTQYVGDSPTVAAQDISSLLVANPDLDGVFSTNVLVAEGTATGINNAGKKGDVKIVGFDADPEQITDLKSGIFQALVAQEPYQEGVDSVQQMVDSLTGKKTTKTIQTPLFVITLANLAADAKYVYEGSCSS
jgi:ribose transport system substrate-binding protein